MPTEVYNKKDKKLLKQLQIKQLEVSSLLEVTQAINNNLSADKLFRIYEFILRAQISVKKLAVFIKDDVYTCICQYGLKSEPDIDEIIESLEPYRRLTFIDDVNTPPLDDFDIVVPVYHKEQPLAYTLLGKPEVDKYETLDEKIRFIQTISNIIVVAIENKRLFKKQIEQERLARELELAAQVQTMLIPDQLPNDRIIEMAAIYLPHRNIGGDYYDYIKKDEDFLQFCIADISGKGVAAAILMANFQATLRSMITEASDFESFIRSLNRRVLDITKGEKFITMFLAEYNALTRELTYVNAGHNPPILYSKNDSQQLESGCTILGMFEELPYVNVGKVVIDDNAILINYTDGLTDLENEKKEVYRLENLMDFININYERSMLAFNDKLMDSIMEFKGREEFIDDISVLSCRFKAAIDS